MAAPALPPAAPARRERLSVPSYLPSVLVSQGGIALSALLALAVTDDLRQLRDLDLQGALSSLSASEFLPRLCIGVLATQIWYGQRLSRSVQTPEEAAAAAVAAANANASKSKQTKVKSEPGRVRKPTGPALSYASLLNSLRPLAGAAASTLTCAVAVAGALILLGAPLTSHLTETALLALLLASLACPPALLTRKLDDLKDADLWLTELDVVLKLPAGGAVLGAWLGAFALPLDWGSAWQVS